MGWVTVLLRTILQSLQSPRNQLTVVCWWLASAGRRLYSGPYSGALLHSVEERDGRFELLIDKCNPISIENFSEMFWNNSGIFNSIIIWILYQVIFPQQSQLKQSDSFIESCLSQKVAIYVRAKRNIDDHAVAVTPTWILYFFCLWAMWKIFWINWQFHHIVILFVK